MNSRIKGKKIRLKVFRKKFPEWIKETFGSPSELKAVPILYTTEEGIKQQVKEVTKKVNELNGVSGLLYLYNGMNFTTKRPNLLTAVYTPNGHWVVAREEWPESLKNKF